MASIETSEATDPEHETIYKEHEQTGGVRGWILEKEAASLAAALGPNPPPVTENDYEDKHVLLSADKRQIIIKHWIIVHHVLVIDLDKIVWIRPASHNVLGFGCHMWGMGLTGIGWSRDFKRAFPTGQAWENSFVVKYRDAWLGLRAGFTIEDPAKFAEALEKIVPGITTRRMHEEHHGQDHDGYTKLDADKGKVKTA
ncbi:hypothetical protein CALCODRAFT_513258 [Calocera cornea HHB12733]|uniref:Uncharacterized protein n=1 Tax=Calocera cornea HHB12733 TaxID=1353952 RepID=A0A165CAD8_9BASI|nr:hypothetical protein CALCODRAFT_513258 [Calocera cornea HHB12733]